MGSFDGAEICELVGLYLLDQLSNLLPVESFGLYRDDGLAILSGISGPDTKRIIKNIRNLFKTNNLKITIEAGMQQTDFLDVTFNADNGKYWPYKKPNSQLQYIHTQSNHPPNIKKQLPKMIEKRLSGISYNQEEFDRAKPAYAHALQKSGYKQKLEFQTENSSRRRQRNRNITWFNPPFSDNVSTNIGRKFLNLLDKHFPPDHKLHPICNRSCVKVSYSCMPNMAAIIKQHNSNVASPRKTDETKLAENCNCRNKSNCPLNENCLKSCLIYKATISSGNQRDLYYGSCSTAFKKRFNNHSSSFRHQRLEKSTELSKRVWEHKNKGRDYQIQWSVIKEAAPYRCGARICSLCLAEKLQIIKAKPEGLLNKRSELISKCRHKNKFLLKNVD